MLNIVSLFYNTVKPPSYMGGFLIYTCKEVLQMIKSHNVYDYKHGEITTKDRKIITPASTFGVLRKQLVKNVGLERLRDILFHFGYETGAIDAKEALKTGKSLESLVTHGPILHVENGQIEGFEHECNFELDDEKKLISLTGQGEWYNSYEAREHLINLGKAKEPICHTLIGYASGFMSTVFNEPMLAKEITCLGMGDECCSWIVKPQKQWELETPNEMHVYRDVPIVKELEYTFEQLVERERFITKLLDFQSLLTNEVAKGYDMFHILNVAYESLNIPIIVDSLQAHSFNYAGISSEKYIELNEDFNEYMNKRGFENTYLTTDNGANVSTAIKIIHTEKQIRLVSPVLVHKELIGWCSFVFENNDAPNDDDYLFLDRLANTVSLLLLNEKTEFETYERMKGNFLDELLLSETSKEELIKKGLFAGIDLSLPYSIAVIDVQVKDYFIEENFEVLENIYESTYTYFKEKEFNVLVGLRDNKITMYLTEQEDCSIEQCLVDLIDYLYEKNSKVDFKCGLSDRHVETMDAMAAYKEAVISLKISFDKSLISYKSLGIIGVLINSENIESIDFLAQRELGELYDLEDETNLELLKTLYFFLRNGGNLKKTKHDLVLSMSGLRHRIYKLESMLNKDLRNPEETYQLLLLIKAMIVTDKLSF